MQRILITGTAGFIGFHLARLLLSEGFCVHGYDGLTDYYDVSLKQRRHQILLEHENFSATIGMLQDSLLLTRVASDFQPDVIIHLAAQAGVRYSLENPRSYLDSNIVGSFNVLETGLRLNVRHLLMASTSSVYGANTTMPFDEDQKTDTPLTIYAATKKANETMAHAYAHLHGLHTTMFRFFTVYGPWGRPDMALFRFTDAILDGRAIDVYNHGSMFRDFTYVDDLVKSIRLLINAIPPAPRDRTHRIQNDSISPVAPFRVVNIGNSTKIRLLDFVEAIEDELGQKAKRNYMGMQPGDVPATWADASLLLELTGYRPNTPYREGVANFVRWYRSYYNK
ncbi:NAD-dependent epimerase/dehydratase family protein [Nitratireductor aestuarii]|uniref:NAD-dependent epimerase/dehydratase family protein n=1 Tax=Nitratireductor aestuarii TaxID=1735103 RepID=UPI00166BB16C|nr:NAD-dependent epimerase/dehydratase family protein [Nitratireductor aestuarii]